VAHAGLPGCCFRLAPAGDGGAGTPRVTGTLGFDLLTAELEGFCRGRRRGRALGGPGSGDGWVSRGMGSRGWVHCAVASAGGVVLWADAVAAY
jgi:hypothetical protein